MYAELYRYLISHKNLPVPGIGIFLIKRYPANDDFPGKKIDPPSYSFILDPADKTPPTNFFKWLAHSLAISDHDAVLSFNDFAFNLKNQLSNGDVVNWNNVGTLSKELSGGIRFLPHEKITLEKPVLAEKVIRQKAEHMVRVGEDERTSGEMSELLSKEEEKKSIWWAAALVLAIISVIFLGWYFSENGIKISTTGNTQKTNIIEATSTYKLLP